MMSLFICVLQLYVKMLKQLLLSYGIFCPKMQWSHLRYGLLQKTQNFSNQKNLENMYIMITSHDLLRSMQRTGLQTVRHGRTKATYGCNFIFSSMWNTFCRRPLSKVTINLFDELIVAFNIVINCDNDHIYLSFYSSLNRN